MGNMGKQRMGRIDRPSSKQPLQIHDKSSNAHFGEKWKQGRIRKAEVALEVDDFGAKTQQLYRLARRASGMAL
jgi:hypothetical protein